jgi:hypothetical protein
MLSDLMEHAKAYHSERLPAQDGDRAGFRESFAAESAVKKSVAPSLAGPSSGHLLASPFWTTYSSTVFFRLYLRLVSTYLVSPGDLYVSYLGD